MDRIKLALTVLIAIELLASWWLVRQRYTWSGVLSNFGIQLVHFVISFLPGTLLFLSVGRYRKLAFDTIAPWHFPSESFLVLALAILLLDFFYYWAHRWSHHVPILWAVHAVHHQSPEYNLSVAFRESVFNGIVLSWPMVMLGVLGIPTDAALTASTLMYVIGALAHTEAVSRLGPLDHLLITPSSHRVHHGTNPEYLNRNFGGITMIWDRLFGTFTPEAQRPNYGMLPTFELDWNPLRAELVPWRAFFASLTQACGWRAKRRAILGI